MFDQLCERTLHHLKGNIADAEASLAQLASTEKATEKAAKLAAKKAAKTAKEDKERHSKRCVEAWNAMEEKDAARKKAQKAHSKAVLQGKGVAAAAAARDAAKLAHEKAQAEYKAIKEGRDEVRSLRLPPPPSCLTYKIR